MPRLARLSVDTPNHNDKDPALARDRARRLWVAWQSYGDKADAILARYTEFAVPGPLVEVSDAPGINFAPALTPDGQDGVWCFWSGVRGDEWRIMGRQMDPSEIEEVVTLGQGAALEFLPAACTDGDGDVFVA